ncbi:Xaa-Pro dipeptidase [Chromatiales bacterium (ex Bugula neritina AB1)]|nr:Xaa-Pro dipeptidase [Chromatiales bacterium (ex Bugula neritina AB1)]
MPVHFSLSEYHQRLQRTVAAIKQADFDGLLLFAPESHYYLTGYDTFGFAMFQCLVVTADGRIELLTRLPDLRQAQQTSIIADENIHIWTEVEGANPAEDLQRLLTKTGLTGGNLGIETRTAGLTAYNGNLINLALKDTVRLTEATQLMQGLRREKSKQEIAYHRRAAELSDDALDAAIETTRPGAFEGDILAAMQGAVFKGGGSYAGNEFIIGSGDTALLCRYHSGPRHLDSTDQLTLEWSGAQFRYQAAMMRTLIVGEANEKQRSMHRAAVEALVSCEEAIRPGKPMGDVYQAHAHVFDRHGLKEARMQACGYGMGAVFNPIWVDFPMFYEGNPLIMNTGNVYFLHMILMDNDTNQAMCWGHSVLVTQNGVERLSRSPLDLIVI